MSPPRTLVPRLAALGLAALLWPVAPAPAQEAKSVVTVIDGDTVEVDGQVFRLYGIDAPELGQTCLDKSKRWRCGLQAAVELRGLLSIWGNVQCGTLRAQDEGVRAICHDPQYNDPAEVLLARGLAIALPDSIPAYKRAEIQAKTAKLGIWRGEFVVPAEWRQGKRLTAPADSTVDSPAEVCDVKGTITDKGEKVYYVPTDEKYAEKSVSAERGERIFCSDDEAELAGWKRYPRD